MRDVTRFNEPAGEAGPIAVRTRFDIPAREAFLGAVRWAHADNADSLEVEQLRRALDGGEPPPEPDFGPPPDPRRRRRPRGVCYRARIGPEVVAAWTGPLRLRVRSESIIYARRSHASWRRCKRRTRRAPELRGSVDPCDRACSSSRAYRALPR
jgi:hypothetical protein